MALYTDVTSSRELLANLTKREVKGKYKRTLLGQLWSLANPLASMLVYTLVFAFIIRTNPDPGDPSGLNIFALWLMCALLPWSFFTATVIGGMNALVGNENLIKKVFFPRSALVVANSFAVAYNWTIEMSVLALALLVVGANVIPFLPVVVIMMAVMFAFALGVALMLSIANVYFRDTQHFVGILFQIWFYLTPIVYPVKLVAEQSDRIGPLLGSITILDIYNLNPMVPFAEVFRNVLYDNRMPSMQLVAVCALWAGAALALGDLLFTRHSKRLAEAL